MNDTCEQVAEPPSANKEWPEKYPGLIPYKKGQSGNPSGRPKAENDFLALCRSHTAEAVETLLSVMRKEKAMSSAKVQAARVLLSYAWGAPKGTDEVDSQVIINILQLAGQRVPDAATVTVRRLAKDNGG